MGARVTRMFRNFNLENRVHREISKEKRPAAPRHPVDVTPAADSAHAVTQKNEPLLSLLKSVYVESTDPAAQASREVTAGKPGERRPLRFGLPGDRYGLVELKDIAKGKLTIAEALKALSSHQLQPQTWTAEKIAEEYYLDLKDARALVAFFVPFQVQIIPPKTGKAKQIQAS